MKTREEIVQIQTPTERRTFPHSPVSLFYPHLFIQFFPQGRYTLLHGSVDSPDCRTTSPGTSCVYSVRFPCYLPSNHFRGNSSHLRCTLIIVISDYGGVVDVPVPSEGTSSALLGVTLRRLGTSGTSPLRSPSLYCRRDEDGRQKTVSQSDQPRVQVGFCYFGYLRKYFVGGSVSRHFSDSPFTLHRSRCSNTRLGLTTYDPRRDDLSRKRCKVR